MKIYFTLVLVICCASMVSSGTEPRDVQVLRDFYNGLENSELLHWPVADEDPCGSGWPYILCNHDRVSSIDVHGLGLKGPVSQVLNQLSNLEEIDLRENQLYGTLPKLKGLSKLRIARFGGNEFDTIPFGFFEGLNDLRDLGLENNPLNSSTGWQIPSGLQHSSKLEVLSLVYCNLVGTIPDWVGTLPALRILKLHNNRFHGEIPSTFGESSLEVLMLHDPIENGLSGTIEILIKMRNLKSVMLQYNHFTGTVPVNIGDLKLLKKLMLGHNELSGKVPKVLSEMNLRSWILVTII